MSRQIPLRRVSIARTLLLLFIATVLLSSLLLVGVTQYLKHESISQLALVEARQQSELIFQSIYSVMRRGWDRSELEEMTARLNGALPDIDIRVVRSRAVAELYGETVGSQALREGDPMMRSVLNSGLDRLIVEGETLRFLYPLTAREECLACHGNVAEGDVNGVIDIHFPATRLKVPLEFTLHTTLVAVGAVLTILFLLLFLGVRATLARPIVQLSRHMAEVRDSQESHRRLEPSSSWLFEIQDLTDNFNELMEALESAKKELQAHSELDPLTGLFNRRKFDQLLDVELGRSRRYGREFVLLMLDLNRFKPINDSLGHAAGDAILKALADSFRHHMRNNDVVARVGGDEFVALLPETPPDQARVLAAKVVQIIEETKTEYAGQPLQVGSSVGAVCFPRDGDDARSLLIAADMAMYADKARRRAESKESQSR